MKNRKKVALTGIALAAILSTSHAQAETIGFDIQLLFGDGLTSSQQDIFLEAENFWESQILGYSQAINFQPVMRISAKGEDGDGVGGVLGSAGPTGGSYGSEGMLYVRDGGMTFDSYDMTNLENNGSLLDVIIHEMAHVIGFGTIWSNEAVGLYVPGSGQYTGEYALAAYQAEYDSLAEYVPVELDGGSGTADGHWDESWAGEQSDLMTGYIEGEITISNTTLASFRDLGYIVASPSSLVSDVPVPFVAGLSLLMLGLARKNKSVK